MTLTDTSGAIDNAAIQMASRELNLVIDQDSGKLLESFTSTKSAHAPRFVLGDSVPVNVRVVTADPDSTWQEVDLTGQSLRVAIGTPSTQPTGGTFAITYGGDETTALAYNASAAVVQTAVNLLASVISAGDVTVTKSINGAYRISFDAVGARTAITTDNTNLYPSTESQAAVATEGDGSTREVVILKLETQPAVYSEFTAALDSASATIATVREGASGVTDIQTFTLSPAPYGGTYAITIGSEKTGAIAWDAAASAIETAIDSLASIGAGKSTVSGSFPSFTVEFDASLADVDQMTLDASGLTVPTGRKGTLNTNSTGIIDLLDGAARVTATLEVEVYDTTAATSFTVLQASCDVFDDVIGNTPSSQTTGPTYLTAAHASDTANPHTVTATQVGLGNVDNTSDANAPVSTAQAAADAVVLAAIPGEVNAMTTVTGAKTFSGQVEATGQAATTDDSVMTRSLARTDTMFQTLLNISPSGWAETIVGSSSLGQSISSFRMSTGSTTGSSILARANPDTRIMVGLNGGSFNVLPFGSRFRIKFTIGTLNPATDTILRFQVGETHTKTTVSDLDKKGFGIKISNTGIHLLTHDGSSLSTSSSVGALPTTKKAMFLIDSDGSGNVALYKDGSLLHTATGGPTSGGSANDTAINFSVENGAGTANFFGYFTSDILIQYGN